MDTHEVIRQYEEGAITFAELIAWLSNDYLVRQQESTNGEAPSCLSCGSDISARVR